ncbi:MAG TPA: MaoC family dehydratase [Terriglobales bacterium]|nr:MaoC family dehydratase [Terriglobales bacterium]
MPKRTFESLDELKQNLGQEVAVTDWFTMTQDRIQAFADATLDHQWIHVDVERAKRESPFKAPIAHGFLTLSMLAYFMGQAVGIKSGLRMGVNYGLNKVRFVSPVRVGSNMRARFVLQALKEVDGNGVEALYNATIETEGSERPACVAEWLVRYYR